jgi:hypothetical protein
MGIAKFGQARAFGIGGKTGSQFNLAHLISHAARWTCRRSHNIILSLVISSYEKS